MRSFSLLILSLLLAACSSPLAGGRYDAGTDRTLFQSRPIDIGQPIGAGNRGASRITLRAEAECMGEGCEPGEYQVSLAKSGGNDASSDYSFIAFETNEGTITFGDNAAAGSSAQFFSTAQGEFARLNLPADIFASFANSPTMTIRLGGSAYSLDYDRRAGLRSLLPVAD